MLIPSFYSEARTPSQKKYYNIGIYLNCSFDEHELAFGMVERLGFKAFTFLPASYAFSTGVVLESEQSASLSIGASLGYYTNSISSTKVYRGRTGYYDPNGYRKYFSNINNVLIDINISALNFSPYISYKAFNDLDVKAGFAFSAFTNVNYSVKALLASSTNPNETPGVINGINEEQKLKNPYVFVSFFLGLSHDFPLDGEKTIIFTPSLEYKIGINNFENSMNWKINSLLASLVLKYKI
jgi:hypothetical protein